MWHIGIALSSLLLLVVSHKIPAIETVPYWVNHASHFLGGMCVGYLSGSIAAVILKYKCQIHHPIKVLLITLAILSGAISGGSLWEEYEYWYVPHEQLQKWTPVGLYADTMNDVRFDRLGGTAAATLYIIFIAIKRVKNKKASA